MKRLKLLRYLFTLRTGEKLPLLPRLYASEFDPGKVDRDTATLMKLTQTRCPLGVEYLKRRYRVSSAYELIYVLPSRRRRAHPGKRFMAILRRMFGTTSYNPMVKIARQELKKGRLRAPDY